MLLPSQARAFLLAITLVGAPVSFASPRGDAETELAALDARFRAAEAALQQRTAAARTDAELQAAYLAAPWSTFAEEYAAFARAHAGRDAGASAWASAVERAAWANRPELVREALEALEREHLESPRLAAAIVALDASSWALGTNRYEVFLRRVVLESPERAVRGFALYTLAASLGLATVRNPSTAVSPVRGEPRVPSELDSEALAAGPITRDELTERKLQARALLATLLADFADTPPPNERLPKDWVRRRAEGLLFELEHLQLGMVAPDFEALDQHGERFELSDYRGRVVLLTFWGTWCVPCRAQLPVERALALRLADQPFSLLGIDSDGDAATAGPLLAAAGVTWRQALDGDTDGPIATRWNVRRWPTTYLLDARGVIRARDLRDEAELSRAVDTLLAEARLARR